MRDDFIVATLAEMIARHERVKRTALRSLTDSIAAIVASMRRGVNQ